LDDALAQEPELKKLYESGGKYRQLIDNARVLEGQARHASVHAAGGIVAARPLHEVGPLYKQSSAGGNEERTQWGGANGAQMGLRTISVVERAKALIQETLPEKAVWEAVGRGAEFEARQRGSEIARQGKAITEGADPVSLSRSLAHPLDLDRLTFDDQRVFDL